MSAAAETDSGRGDTRLWVALAVLALLMLSALPVARAQHHHGHAGHESTGSMGEHGVDRAPGLVLHAGLHLESGRAEAFGADRDYQGVALMVGARRGRFELGLHLPVYRIELGSAASTGLGDMHLMGRWIAWMRGTTEIGMSAGYMPPFGDDEGGIGMGHSMIMAGGFARASRGRWTGEITLGYGGSLGSGGHAEHGVLVWPSVSPMNGKEIRSTAQLGIDVSHGVGVSLSGLGAVPVGNGAFLALAGAEVTYRLGRYTAGAGARHGLAQHTANLVLTSSLMGMF